MHSSQDDLQQNVAPGDNLSIGSGSVLSSRCSTLPRASNVNYQELFRAYPKESNRDRKLKKANEFFGNRSFSVRKVLRKLLSSDNKPTQARSLDFLTSESNYSPCGSLRPSSRNHDNPMLVGGGYTTDLLDSKCYLKDLPVINGKQPGLTGLINHGNTCFINSILHCLGNTELFMLYFILDYYKPALDDCMNTKNTISRKFGTCGELTEQLADILKAIWTCDYKSDQTSNFKNTCSKYNSQYKGNLQHDAQEFLLWLLDKIHSDLNVAKKKKYKNIKGGKAKSDETLAAESLSNYSRCNNSFIYDLFQAQFRSSLECMSCGKQSNTFDPYLCVSLPIPSCDTVDIAVYLTQPTSSEDSLDGYQRAVKSVRVERDGVLSEARTWLCEQAEIAAPSSLVLITTNKSGFSSWCLDYDQVSSVLTSQEADSSTRLHALQAPSDYRKPVLGPTSSSKAGGKLLVVACSVTTTDEHNTSLIGPPVIFTQERACSLMTLKKSIVQYSTSNAQQPQDVTESDYDEGLTLSLVNDSQPTSLLSNNPLQSTEVASALQCGNVSYEPTYIRLLCHWSSSLFLKLKSQLSSEEQFPIEVNVNEEPDDPQQTEQRTISLLDCFHLYTKMEELSSDNTWACSGCNDPRANSKKKLSLWSLPEVLVIHLKRFRQTLTSRTKVHSLVEYPVEALDMSPFISSRDLARAQLAAHRVPHLSAWQRHKQYRLNDREDTLYDLVAVCNHIGQMSAGHYTAFCKNPVKQEWYEFDDTKIRPVSPSDIVCKNAYLLFYQRRSAHAIVKTCDPSDHWIHQLLLNKGCDTNLMDWVQSPPPQFLANGGGKCSSPVGHAATIGTSSLPSFVATPTRQRSKSRPTVLKSQPSSPSAIGEWSSANQVVEKPTNEDSEQVSNGVAPLVQDEEFLSDSESDQGTKKGLETGQ